MPATITEDQFDTAHDAYQDVYDGDNHRAALRHALEAAIRPDAIRAAVAVVEERGRTIMRCAEIADAIKNNITAEVIRDRILALFAKAGPL